MEWSLDRKRPIVPQLCEQICVQISCGQFPVDCRLPSVRDIALSAGVNPNTVQKSLEQLAEQGIVRAERGSGWYVTDSLGGASVVKDSVIREKTEEYFASMQALGLDVSAVKQYIKEWNE